MYYYADPPWPAGTANLCIKALTLDEDNVPVELISFNAVNEGSSIRLNWTTAAETNNNRFEIERRSLINETIGDWILIGYKEGKGTTTETQHYSYVDDIKGINAASLEYRLKQVDFDGSYTFSEEIRVHNIAPDGFILAQNYPNPFNPVTTVHYSLGNKQHVSLKVYDILGNEVANLVNEEKETGSYKVEFDAGNLSSGIYYYTIITDNFMQTKKMILLK
jgi:hypothetical protein